MKKKFWSFIKDEAEAFELRLDGPISEDSWWGDEVTPQMFRDDLEQVSGDLTVWINSPGGDVFAADQIYNMLQEYQGKITVKIDAIAASAATIVAMAGDEVYVSPVSMMMVHDPSTIAIGNESDMKETIKVLKEVKETIINAYMAKTGRSHDELAALMKDDGTWMNAKKAVELGFADGILYEGSEPENLIATAYSPYHVVNSLVEKVKAAQPVSPEPVDPEPKDNNKNLRIRMRMMGISAERGES